MHLTLSPEYTCFYSPVIGNFPSYRHQLCDSSQGDRLGSLDVWTPPAETCLHLASPPNDVFFPRYGDIQPTWYGGKRGLTIKNMMPDFLQHRIYPTFTMKTIGTWFWFIFPVAAPKQCWSDWPRCISSNMAWWCKIFVSSMPSQCTDDPSDPDDASYAILRLWNRDLKNMPEPWFLFI